MTWLQRRAQPSIVICPECGSQNCYRQTRKWYCLNCRHEWTGSGNKFRAKKTSYNGRKYASKGEAGLAAELDMALRAGVYILIEPQKWFTLRGPDGCKLCDHVVDFLCTYPDGRLEVQEFKSEATATPVWYLKYKLFKSNYPSINYVLRSNNPRWSHAFRNKETRKDPCQNQQN